MAFTVRPTASAAGVAEKNGDFMVTQLINMVVEWGYKNVQY